MLDKILEPFLFFNIIFFQLKVEFYVQFQLLNPKITLNQLEISLDLRKNIFKYCSPKLEIHTIILAFLLIPLI
jgi:hypothetical protein